MEVARFAAREQDIRRAIVGFATRKKASRSVLLESVSTRPDNESE